MAALGTAGYSHWRRSIIFAALKTKTKLIDEGLRIKLTVNAFDVLVKNFKLLRKSQFFGLSKKIAQPLTRRSMKRLSQRLPLRSRFAHRSYARQP